MTKIELCMLLCCIFSSSVCARSFNEMLELAIENSDEDSVRLILKQATVTQDEKIIFLKLAQEVIDDLNEELALALSNNSGGAKRMAGGFCMGLCGVVTTAAGIDNNYGRFGGVAKCGFVATISGLALCISGIRAAIAHDRKFYCEMELSAALRIKDYLIQMRTKK